MPCRRSRSATGTPASPSFKIATICSSVNRDFRMLPPRSAGGVYHAVVSAEGTLTDAYGPTFAGTFGPPLAKPAALEGDSLLHPRSRCEPRPRDDPYMGLSWPCEGGFSRCRI